MRLRLLVAEIIEEIEHTADYAIHVQAEDLPALFIAAARGMNSLTGGRPADLSVQRQIKVSAADLETLLVSWLEELAFIMEVEGEIFDQFDMLSFSPTALHSRVGGGPVTRLNKMIKAVTFHDLSIQETDTGWMTSIVFDV
jgi:SHS2 domain-containing protein